MERLVALTALGIGLGAAGTIIGAGGGFLLVPVLLLLYPADAPEVIASISLAVVFLNALAGSISYARMRRIHYEAGALFAAATIPGAVLGALSTTLLGRGVFDRVLGLAIAAAGLFLLWDGASGKQERGNARAAAPDGPQPHNERPRYNRLLGMLISAGVGYVSSLLGIGGGIIHVPALVRLLGFPVHMATATSHFVLAFTAGTGTLTHILTGAFHHGIRRTIALGVGVMIGAPAGAAASARLPADWIVRGLGAALLFAGLRLLVA